MENYYIVLHRYDSIIRPMLFTGTLIQEINTSGDPQIFPHKSQSFEHDWIIAQYTRINAFH